MLGLRTIGEVGEAVDELGDVAGNDVVLLAKAATRRVRRGNGIVQED